MGSASRGSGRVAVVVANVARADEPGRVAYTGRTIMKAMKNLVIGLINDEKGGEVLEYALIAGLIVVAAIAMIGAVGNRVLARWTSLNSSM